MSHSRVRSATAGSPLRHATRETILIRAPPQPDRDAEAPVALDWRHARAAIAKVVARPQNVPGFCASATRGAAPAHRSRSGRLEVHHEQAVTVIAEEPEQERRVAHDSPMAPALSRWSACRSIKFTSHFVGLIFAGASRFAVHCRVSGAVEGDGSIEGVRQVRARAARFRDDADIDGACAGAEGVGHAVRPERVSAVEKRLLFVRGGADALACAACSPLYGRRTRPCARNCRSRCRRCTRSSTAWRSAPARHRSPTGRAASAVLDESGAPEAPWLRGHRIKVLDGNHLAATERRLKVLRGCAAGPPPARRWRCSNPRRDWRRRSSAARTVCAGTQPAGTGTR